VDWYRRPGRGEDATSGVAELLARAQQELGGPLLGAKFLYDARQMFAATREIERAVSEPGTTLYVGFQRAEKLDGEAHVYRRLTGQGVEVIAFGTGAPAEVSQVRWVRLPEDHDALANQWFLVTETPEPIAFVGFETSPPDRIGEGGAADPSRTWAGFVTDDPRLVGAIAGYLQAVSDREAPRPWTIPRWRSRRCCWSRPTTEPTRPMRCAAGPAWRWPGAKVLRWSPMTGRLSRTWWTPMSPGRGHRRTTVRPGRRFLPPMS
jgi:Sensory domain in DIguanylate Cyclases and Two-component system